MRLQPELKLALDHLASLFAREVENKFAIGDQLRLLKENLTPEQQQDLKRLKRKFPALAKLADHRESLRQIFEDKRITTAEQGIEKLNQWREQGKQLGCMRSINSTKRCTTGWTQSPTIS